MTRSVPAPSGAWRWGRGIQLALYAMVVLNGVWLYLFQLGPAMFEIDTGRSLLEVTEAYPQVVRYLRYEVRLAALLFTGVGAIGFVGALSLAGDGDRRLWRLLWLPAALLAGVAALILATGQIGVGLYHLALSAVALASQLLLGSARGGARP